MKWVILGHFHSFFPQKWFKSEELWIFEHEKSIFPLYLTKIVVDQDLSFKKSESYFFMSNICHLIMGLNVRK